MVAATTHIYPDLHTLSLYDSLPISDLQVSPEEINNALVRTAQRYPGQERQVIDFYRNNEQAMANLRAPLYEEKVVDYILEMAAVTEKEVSVEEIGRASCRERVCQYV